MISRWAVSLAGCTVARMRTRDATFSQRSLRKSVDSWALKFRWTSKDKLICFGVGDALTQTDCYVLRMASASELIGQTISHYRIIEKLGDAGMVVVYNSVSPSVVLLAVPTANNLIQIKI